MARELRDELVFVPLGGVGEIGMNMAAYGFGPANRRKWIVVDCGVTFAGPDLPGIDLIMPNPRFLEDEGDNVLALILTHSHEDHFGAVFDIWPDFDKPVYATPFTTAMLAAKRASNGISARVDVRPMQTGRPFSIGPFSIEPINMAHSIPESCALLIETSLGRVLHSGDWKLDATPVGSPPTDVARLQKIGEQGGPLALICDSTNAVREGESPSESDIGETLEQLILAAPHRVAVTTFASNLGRLISVARAAEKAGRQVVLSGRAMHRITTIARELGMMEGVPPFLDQDMFSQLPRSKVVVLCTGSQGESRAAIARIAAGEHPAIDLNAGDTMIFSSWAIPGNERVVADIQNQLIDRGVNVITNSMERVHVTGHPRRGEMRRLYEWVKPDVLVPVHGEAVHLHAHASLGRECGIRKVIEARNGDLVRLFPEAEHLPGEVPVGELYLDGELLCTPDESGVRGRRRLALGGMISVSLCINRQGDVVAGPEVELEGIPTIEDEEEESAELVVRAAIRGALRSLPAKRRNAEDTVAEAIRRSVRGEVGAFWGRKPNVKVFVHKVQT